MDQLKRLQRYRAAEHLPFVIGRAVALMLEPASATTAMVLKGRNTTPPMGPPGAGTQGGNSAPARALVAGAGKSPGFGPGAGE